MLGLSLPIVATATILIGQTATDAAPVPFLGEVRIIHVRCRAVPVPEGYYRGRYLIFRSVIGTGGTAVIAERREEIHINMQTMAYYVLREQRRGELPDWRVVEEGVCKETP
jgi:hypothetical protein